MCSLKDLSAYLSIFHYWKRRCFWAGSYSAQTRMSAIGWRRRCHGLRQYDSNSKKPPKCATS